MDLHDAYSGHPQAKRGLQFSYMVNGAVVTSTTTTTTRSTYPGETTVSTTTTTGAPTSPSGTNAAGYPTAPSYPQAGSGEFPIDEAIDESECGTVFYDPVINNFDYVAQDLYVRNATTYMNTADGFVVNGEEAVPYRSSFYFY